MQVKKISQMKLVRDHIPQIITDSGRTPITEIIPESEYLTHLDRKLTEEVNEYLESKDIMEICDVLEVLYAIMDAHGYSKAEIEQLRTKKASKNGEFKQRIFLKEIIE